MLTLLLIPAALAVFLLCRFADDIARWLWPVTAQECLQGHPEFFGPHCPVCERLKRGWPRRTHA